MAESTENANAARPQFRMQKMYIKDLSFENPNAPSVFTEHQGEPKVDVNLKLGNKKIDEEHWEVTLAVQAKVLAKKDDKVLFILEIEHAGVFMMKNIPEEHLSTLLGIDCPTLLFPFTRQIVSQVSVDGGFIPFLMEPVNFMALFQNAKKNKENKDSKKDS
ncbi:MAG: protein-export chaperone SecB [Deltaproteobacteria bacterium]|nr:MAG: protein-export chaperone SecB [Deltaproteobacteria bacterium]